MPLGHIKKVTVGHLLALARKLIAPRLALLGDAARLVGGQGAEHREGGVAPDRVLDEAAVVVAGCSSASAISSSAREVSARVAAPPRHRRTASGGASPTQNMSLTATCTSCERKCEAKVARDQGAGSESQR